MVFDMSVCARDRGERERGRDGKEEENREKYVRETDGDERNR